MKPLGVDASAEIRRGFHVLQATTALVAYRGGLGAQESSSTAVGRWAG